MLKRIWSQAQVPPCTETRRTSCCFLWSLSTANSTKHCLIYWVAVVRYWKRTGKCEIVYHQCDLNFFLFNCIAFWKWRSIVRPRNLPQWMLRGAEYGQRSGHTLYPKCLKYLVHRWMQLFFYHSTSAITKKGKTFASFVETQLHHLWCSNFVGFLWYRTCSNGKLLIRQMTLKDERILLGMGVQHRSCFHRQGFSNFSLGEQKMVKRWWELKTSEREASRAFLDFRSIFNATVLFTQTNCWLANMLRILVQRKEIPLS